MSAKIKRDDEVIVLTGRDKGKKGKVVSVFPKENRAIVTGINIVTKHKRATQTTEAGIKKEEASINLSNIALVDPKSGEATKVGFKEGKDGKKIRFAKKSGEEIK